MDDPRFDAWTRRRAGLAAGGALVAVLGLATYYETAATTKKNRRREEKKRCRKKSNRTWCRNECVRGTCCPGKRCAGGDDCGCGLTVEGTAFCVDGGVAVLYDESCPNSAACAGDTRCVRLPQPCGTGGDVTALCLPPCGFVP
jgi:hypothetical protein